MHNLVEAPTELGQVIDPARRRRRQGAPPDEADGFKGLQPRSQEVGRHAGEARNQVGETLGPGQQLADDEQRPTLTNAVESQREATVLLIRLHD